MTDLLRKNELVNEVFIRNEKECDSLKIFKIFKGVELIISSLNSNFSLLSKHKNNNLEIHFLLEGESILIENDSNYLIKKDDILIFNKIKSDKNYLLTKNFYKDISINIDLDLAPKCFSCFLDNFDVDPSKIKEKFLINKTSYIFSNDKMKNIFLDIKEEINKENIRYFKIKILELLYYLSTYEIKEEVKLSLNQIELARQIKEYIDSRIKENISLFHLSNKFYFSSKHIQESFKGVYKTTISNYIKKEKMNKASICLKESNLSVLEIAYMFGYNSPSKFSKSFLKIIGKKPLEYRKEAKIKESSF